MKKILLGLSFLVSLVAVSLPFSAQASELDDKQQEIEELEQKIADLQGQQKTLSSTIAFLDTKISLTQAQISKTQVELKGIEADIATLSGKINTLNVSLDRLTELLVNRITTTYKRNLINPITLLFSSGGFSDFLTKLEYLRLVQRHDRRIIFATEQARANYDAQKDLKEAKQAEVEALNARLIAEKASLARQQAEKQQLLQQTKNDEATYQNLLAKAVAELAAIQGIIAGKGTETEVGPVTEGNKIASYIPSSSTCSSGPHLHFEVTKDDSRQDPSGLLGGANLSYAYDTSQIPETINPGGSWIWPVNDPIRITQIYGHTYWTQYLHYDFHTGIDMQNSNGDTMVKAVKPGKLFRGSIACGGGTLRYVRVEHDQDNVDSYYLHVNYI